MRVYYQVYMPLTERSAEVDCYRTLDRKIAWDASGNKRWKPQDIRALCYKTENAVATADCFENIFAQSGNTVDSIYACQSEAAQIARSNAAYRQQVKASEKAMLTQLVSNWRSQQAGEKAASARAPGPRPAITRRKRPALWRTPRRVKNCSPMRATCLPPSMKRR
jgi:hypothetical protein